MLFVKRHHLTRIASPPHFPVTNFHSLLMLVLAIGDSNPGYRVYSVIGGAPCKSKTGMYGLGETGNH